MGGSKHICNTQCINHNFPPLANVVPFVVKAPLLNYQNGGGAGNPKNFMQSFADLLYKKITKVS